VSENTEIIEDKSNDKVDKDSHIAIVMRRNNEVLIEINKIYCESNLDTMKRMPDNFIDLTVTSPPYDNLRDYKGYSFDFEAIAKELYRVTKQGGVVVWVVGDATINGSESGTSFKQALYFKEIGFDLLDTMIYAKPPRGAVGNNKIYWQAFEYMFILSKGEPKAINLISDRKNQESREGDNSTKRIRNGDLLKIIRGGYADYGRRTNIWQYQIGQGQSTHDEIAFDHPAIFPERLAYDHIISWSNEGDLVYDPFMGSGTTAKAAIASGRNYIGSEISEEYCQIIKKRLHPLLNNLFVQEEKTEC
jgi:DNA modification methylase